MTRIAFALALALSLAGIGSAYAGPNASVDDGLRVGYANGGGY